MADADLSLLEPVPRCPIQHKRVPNGQRRDRKACPWCAAWDRRTRAVRRQELRLGQRTVKHRPGAVKPIVKAHRCDDHGTGPFVAGCVKCQAWNRYQLAIRREEERVGAPARSVDAGMVRDHLKTLVDMQTGGWFLYEIEKVSGVGQRALGEILGGKRSTTVLASTWDAVRTIKPKGVPRPTNNSTRVDATECRRIAQGLAAQGWSFEHMAQLCGKQTRSSIGRRARTTHRYVEPEVLDEMRALRDKLGPYDVDTVDELPPGMFERCATHARARGWLPLSAWDGVDITDPDAQPVIASLAPPPPVPVGVSPIDPELRRRVIAAAEELKEGLDHNRGRTLYVAPLGRLTRIELHAVVMISRELGLSSSETGQLLGYPTTKPDGREDASGERQVSRVRGVLREAEKWRDMHTSGETPDVFTRPRTPGRDSFADMVPMLLALQPAPYGPGWSVAELADRCGVTEQVMLDFIARASAVANQLWTRNVSGGAKPKRRRRSVRRRRPSGRVARAA